MELRVIQDMLAAQANNIYVKTKAIYAPANCLIACMRVLRVKQIDQDILLEIDAITENKWIKLTERLELIAD